MYVCACEVVLNSHRLLDNKQCAAVAVPQELDKVFWPDAMRGRASAMWACGKVAVEMKYVLWHDENGKSEGGWGWQR